MVGLQEGRCLAGSNELSAGQAKKHAENFVAAYGWQSCRPKLHCSMHIPGQVDRKQRCLDAFACERKHRYFKTNIATNVLRISDFCSTALLKCVERDVHSSPGCTRLDMRLIGKQRPSSELASRLGCSEAFLSDNLEVNAVTYGRGQYRVLSATQAIEIQKVARVGSDHLGLVKRNEIIPGLSHWCQKSEDVCCACERCCRLRGSYLPSDGDQRCLTS